MKFCDYLLPHGVRNLAQARVIRCISRIAAARVTVSCQLRSYDMALGLSETPHVLTVAAPIQANVRNWMRDVDQHARPRPRVWQTDDLFGQPAAVFRLAQ